MATVEDVPKFKDKPPGDDLPITLATLIIIVVCSYLLIICVFLLIRKLLLAKGFCADFYICGTAKGDAGFCECCIPCVEALNCKMPTMKGALDVCCPQSKLDVGGCFMCSPCGADGQSCCNFAGFDCVPGYTGEDADAINCLCFELRTSGYPDPLNR